MTWTRLSDTFADSPAVLPLSDAAFRLHITALVWCNKQLTDGVVPARAVRLLTAEPDPEPIVRELVVAALWVEADQHYLIDWTDQETAASVQTRAAAHAARNREYRGRIADRQARHAAGDHSKCDRCAAVRDASRAPSHDASNDDRPSPTRPEPDPTDREGRAKGAAASAEMTAGSRSASPAVTSAGDDNEATRAALPDRVVLLHDLELLSGGAVLPRGFFDALSADEVEAALTEALELLESEGCAHGCAFPLQNFRPDLWDALSHEPVRVALSEHCEPHDLFDALAELVHDPNLAVAHATRDLAFTRDVPISVAHNEGTDR